MSWSHLLFSQYCKTFLRNTSLQYQVITKNKSSHRKCSGKKDVLRNFSKFTGKHLHRQGFFLLKKRLWYRCFPVNFAKFLRTPFLQNISERLLPEETSQFNTRKYVGVSFSKIYELPLANVKYDFNCIALILHPMLSKSL